jgi:hypothetical protein
MNFNSSFMPWWVYVVFGLTLVVVAVFFLVLLLGG